MIKFVIIGLPRSGTTYLMSMINAHPQAVCSGERFNPYSIIGVAADRNDAFDAVLTRDYRATAFFDASFAQHHPKEPTAIGIKFMIGHNIEVLHHLASQPDLRLIYVHRANKLAQITSLLRALETGVWAETKHRPPAPPKAKLRCGPRVISHHLHEYATQDMLFAHWFNGLPHQKMIVEYRDMHRPDFATTLCRFLGLPVVPDLRGTLQKQGTNTILDRFEHRAVIAEYFAKTGHADWLGDEL